ncbi:MAG: 50S ribosomal protein L9 [Rhabdochlamydiaceae bacterium]
MKKELLLVEDVENLGRSGDIVSVKPGFARNFLLPKRKAVVADAVTLKMRAKLQEERAKKAAFDQKESLDLAERLSVLSLLVEVKVDPDGHMYGSVGSTEILNLLDAHHIKLEKRNLSLPHGLKTLGAHKVVVKLKEGVHASFDLNIVAEGSISH